MANKRCTNRVKCCGLKKDGTLKKGYVYKKGGVIVKLEKKDKKRK